MNVRVDATRGQYQTLSRQDIRADADHKPRIDAVHDVRITRLADSVDASSLDTNVSLNDAPVIEDQAVGDDEVRDVQCSRRLSHSVTDGFASTEFDFLPVHCVVRLDLDDQVGIRQA